MLGIHAICLAQDATELPAECAATAIIHGEVQTRVRVTETGKAPVEQAVPDLVSMSWAERFARALAPLRDATPEGGESMLPDSARLLDLLQMDPPTPEAIAATWGTGGRSTRALLGVGLEGPYAVDVKRDGPHGLVAGTTGAGKSELLQTLIAALAVANRADEFSFVLVDYKGGAAFKDCMHLPHTVGISDRAAW
jgi:S-DNA-T family DNA segregation ATPase FtsK/SpoIIIE